MRFTKLAAAAAALAMTAGMMMATPASATNIGNEGCTPGYWKNHTDNWQEYSTDTLLKETWTLGQFEDKWGGKTFEDALSFQGGAGLDGAFQILMRASVAAYLNAAHEGLGYPLRRFNEPGDMEKMINDALASGSRQQMIDLAKKLDGYNNLGCPLN